MNLCGNQTSAERVKKALLKTSGPDQTPNSKDVRSGVQGLTTWQTPRIGENWEADDWNDREVHVRRR